jgi:nucleoside-diphosphate-sugar epimerase
MEEKPVLVTGGTGFIGTYIVDALLRRGIRTRVFASNPAREGCPSGAELIHGDIREEGAVSRAMRGARGVIHAAAGVSAWASDPSFYHETNVRGTRYVLRAALGEGVLPFVHFSSCAAIEFRGRGLLDESAIVPRTRNLTEYGRSKALAEQEVERAVQEGLNAAIVYPTRVFGIGPLTDANAATRALALYVRGELKVLPGGGKSRANWGYVNDIAEGAVRALERGRRGERYLLGGENISLGEIVALAGEIAGTRLKAVPIPLRAGHLLALLEEWRAWLTRTPPRITRLWYDGVFEEALLSCSRAKDQIGYRVTPLREALERVIAWLTGGSGDFPPGGVPRSGTL